MAKYIFPAVFTPEPEGGYSVSFPDLDGCYTCGETLTESFEMANDVLALTLYGYEKDQKAVPSPGNPEKMPHKDGEIVNYVYADTAYYHEWFKKYPRGI